MKNIGPANTHIDDEVDIRQLIKAVWEGRWLIIISTFLFSTIFVIYSLSLPNIYQAQTLLSPVGENTQVQNQGSIGGLASLAGINLSSGSVGNSGKALEKVKTFSFFEENILPNILIQDLMAIESWDASNNIISYNENIFNENTQTWIQAPSLQRSYQSFMSAVTFYQNPTTFFVTISVKHQSPYVAKAWTELIVDQINYFFRSNDKKEAEASIDFLNAQIAQTSYTEIKQVIAQLLQQKIQQLTLIEANDNYVFAYLDPPIVMEEKIEPSRSSISILGALLGGMLGIIFVLIRHYFLSRR